ncbi:LysR family transcriptional regulator [Pseudoalteromonas luteoviolacea]|uniref:LysR family transcriptional regulator n=1 Tax=Pseudoalteromonas luteoviolacea TaxID=43657 RepID=UPI0011537C2D|nr:LysR family transcriptional regulator [Pseudoalteromonas luteoviolacea]TQF66823.1 LysR family transcriptional regulator [Pseudoalteromonas luteoviolacea]
MNNDLNQIRIFCKVAQLQSFTQAAQALDIEKSTVSNKVSQLEARLGVKLLQRTTRSVKLTEEGAQYLHFCEQAMSQLEQGEAFLSDMRQQASGHLRVAVPQNFADFMASTIVIPFLQAHPQITLEVQQGAQNVDLIKAGFDVAIRASFNNIEDSSLIYRKIYQSQRVFVASSNFAAKYGVVSTVEQLRSQPYIASFAGERSDESFNQVHAQGKWHTLNARLSVNSTAAVLSAVEAGLGFAIMPTGMVRDKIASGEFVQIAADITLTDSVIFLVYPSRHGQPAKLKAFIDTMVQWGESMMQSNKAR